MLKTLLWIITLGVLINISLPAYAQQPPQLLAALQELERQSGKKWLVTWNDLISKILQPDEATMRVVVLWRERQREGARGVSQDGSAGLKR